MAPDPAGDGAEAGPLTSATPALPGRSPEPRISYSIEYADTRLIQEEFRQISKKIRGPVIEVQAGPEASPAG